MTDRYDRDRNHHDNRTHYTDQRDYYGARQAEQFDDSSSYGQDDDWQGRGRQYGDRSQTGGSSYEDAMSRSPSRNRSYGRTERSGFEANRTPSAYDRYDRSSFGGSSSGGASFSRDRSTSGRYGGGYEAGRYDRDRFGSGDSDRGFMERAGDEIASWFGDEDAARRRQADHRGSGPAGYTRSDERILEDTCDCLTEDRDIDARNIQVTVKGGEVTLDGTVDDRGAKRRAEDIVQDVSGVGHVQNNLRVQDRSLSSDTTSTTEL